MLILSAALVSILVMNLYNFQLDKLLCVLCVVPYGKTNKFGKLKPIQPSIFHQYLQYKPYEICDKLKMSYM